MPNLVTLKRDLVTTVGGHKDWVRQKQIHVSQFSHRNLIVEKFWKSNYTVFLFSHNVLKLYKMRRRSSSNEVSQICL